MKVQPVDVKSSIYIDFIKENNDKDPKFKIGDIVRISKYKNISSKGYIPNWFEDVFEIKKLKILCRELMLLVVLIDRKLLDLFRKKIAKAIKKNLN